MSNTKKFFSALSLAIISAVFTTSAHALVVTSTEFKNIPETGTIESILNVGTHGIISDLNVKIISLIHTYDSDLLISLQAPTGKRVVLSQHRGASGDNFTNTLFDDGATTLIGAGNAPFTGSFRPEEFLSGFNGIDAFGTWKLIVTDSAAGDSGQLRSWNMDMTMRAAAVPEPGSLALMGLALAGLAAARRRRRAA